MLGATVDVVMDVLLVQLFGQLGDDHADVFLPLGALHAHLLHQVLIARRIDVTQGQILQLLLDGVYAQPMRQGRVDVQRLPGDRHLPRGALIFERAHIVQPVGQLDEHHADVPAHRQDHLAQTFRLRLLLVGEVQLVQLRHAVHQMGDLLAELLADSVEGHALAVLHRVVQQSRRNGRRVDHQLREDARHEAGVDEVRLAALALLPGVGRFRKTVRLFHQLVAVARIVLLHPRKHLIQRHGLIGGITHQSILLSGW